MKTVLNPPTTVRDIALLIARVLVGVVLIAHGLQKFAGGLGSTVEGFGQMGVPLPQVAAPVAAVIELVGGLLLIVGAFSAITGLLVALQMGGAFLFAHMGNGIFVADGGWELVGVIAAAALAVGVAGAGRFSIDALLTRRTSATATQVEHDRKTVTV